MRKSTTTMTTMMIAVGLGMVLALAAAAQALTEGSSSLRDLVTKAKVIVVVTMLGSDPVPPNRPGDLPEVSVRWKVARVLKGNIAEKVIAPRMPAGAGVGEFAGKEWIVFLTPEYLAGMYRYAAILNIKEQDTVRAIVAEQAVAREVAKLIDQLGSETAAARDAAQEALVKIGLPALPALRVATADKNGVRATRARDALRQIEQSPACERIRQADERLAAMMREWSEAGGAKVGPDEDAIRRLIEQLGAASLGERKAAQQALVKIGPPAAEALAAATDDKNAERASRSRDALAEMPIRKEDWPVSWRDMTFSYKVLSPDPNECMALTVDAQRRALFLQWDPAGGAFTKAQATLSQEDADMLHAVLGRLQLWATSEAIAQAAPASPARIELAVTVAGRFARVREPWPLSPANPIIARLKRLDEHILVVREIIRKQQAIQEQSAKARPAAEGGHDATAGNDAALALAEKLAAKAADDGNTMTRAAEKDIANIVAGLNVFEIDTGRYPTTAEGLAALLEKPIGATEWRGPYIRSKANDGKIDDPWGRPYVYRCPGKGVAQSFDMLSLGPDGKEGTADDVRGKAMKTPAPAGGPVSVAPSGPGQPRGSATSTGSGQATQPDDAASAKRIVQLIEQLGAEGYKDRQAAQDELVKIGLPAVEALNAAGSDKDPERAQRAKIAMKAIVPNTVTISVEGPIRVNMPVWVNVITDNDLLNANLRYPFTATPWFFKQYAFEVRKAGRLLPMRAINRGSQMLESFGSVAPPSSPKCRLPLHLVYSFAEPGKYEVRLLVYRDGVSPSDKTDMKALVAVSDWIKLNVQAMPEAARKQWQSKMTAQPTEDIGLLVGDYLPSLLACADETVAGILEDLLHHKSTLVQNYALYSLWAYYDDARLGKDIPAIIKKKGPTSLLAYYLSWRRDLFADRAPELVDSCIGYLGAGSDETVDGATKGLMWLKYHYDWTKRPEMPGRIDAAILGNADAIIKRPEAAPRQALAVYLGGIKTEASRKLLWKLAEDKDTREQSVIALCWIADPGDLPELAKILLENESRAAASLPYHLYRAFGKASLPYLEKAAREAPSEFVRKECSNWLKAANDPRTGILPPPGERELTLQGPEVNDDYLLRLKGAHLDSLMLYQTSVTDDGMANLTQVASLRTLYLRTRGVKGQGLIHLKEVNGLQSLELMGSVVDEKALVYVAEVDDLRGLAMWSMRLTGAGLARLATMKDLSKLTLYGCEFEDADLAKLGALKTLKALDLMNCGITDAGLAQLKAVAGLKELNITGGGLERSHITDAGLAHLAALKDLEKLELTGQSSITSDGMKHLAGLKRLKTLMLDSTGVQVQAIKNMQQIETLRLSSGQVQAEDLQAMKNLSKLWVKYNGPLS
jgi:type II secretion system protein G